MNLDQPTQANNKIRLPKNAYGIRCIDAEFKKSAQKQTPFIELTWEICDPETLNLPTGQVKIAGIKGQCNFWLTDKAISRLIEFHKIMGFPLGDLPDSDDEAMKEYVNRYKGLGAKAILSAKENRMQKEVIGEDGEVTREDLLDDDGKPIVNYRVEVGTFLKKDDRFKVEMA